MTDTNFQKIWKDPVWSKVIAAIIIAIASVVYSFFASKSADITFTNSLKNFWTTKIQLWLVALIFIGYLVITRIFNYSLKPHKQSFIYDDKTLALDTSLFDRIRKDLLPQDGTIYWLRHNNFAGFSFNDENLNQLDAIEYEAKKSDFEFLNPELETIKNDLIKEIDTFTTSMAVNTFPTKSGRQSVPPEWELEQPERFWKVVGEIHANQLRICDKYDELIKTGRRLLKV